MIATPKARRLDRADFNRPTLEVARHLIGKFIVHKRGSHRLEAMIVEVEAYKGPRDLAAHSAKGRRTARVEPLYGDGGTVYVYFIYGIHWMLNFATVGRIRGVLADPEGEARYLAGPGRVTTYLGIDKAVNAEDAVTSKRVWLEDRGVRVPASRIVRGPRIGVDYAGEYWAARPWRFRIDAATAQALVTNRD
jgi:DNA-3-methyladenine glycosylase